MSPGRIVSSISGVAAILCMMIGMVVMTMKLVMNPVVMPRRPPLVFRKTHWAMWVMVRVDAKA